MSKKVFLKNFGCQMNVRDSEFVAGILVDRGYALSGSIEDADVILFNSCSVRKHAEERLFSNIGELNRLKKKRPRLVIGLMGCTAQSYKEKALERAPMLDLVCGPGNEHDIPGLLDDVIKNRCAIVAADKVNDKRPEISTKYRAGNFKAYVSISEGCNNFCSYCVVPYVRGRERSRDAKDIVREVKDLAGKGFKEITLLGQNVNSYGLTTNNKKQTTEFIRLLRLLDAVKGIERIRFMTSHPKDAGADLFKATRDLKKVCEHLHLPLQSGSDRILGLMNRKYTAKKYMRLTEAYRKYLPEGSITTDIIVGFPSETETDFKKTFRLIKEIGFDSAFTFKYSPRPPAISARLKDDVPAKVKERRLAGIIKLQTEVSGLRNQALIGSTVEVLVDGHNRKDPDALSGRTRTNKTVVFSGDRGLIGRFVNILIDSATPYALKGRMVL